jgi:hypothetical protein
MTASLCLRCATLKDGPWAPCPDCAFQPVDSDDMAKAMILSEEKYTREELLQMRGRHQQGEPWHFDAALVTQCRARMDNAGRMTTTGNQGASTFKEPWPVQSQDPSNVIVDQYLLPIMFLGIPLLPIEAMGRAVVKVATLGTVSCRTEITWIIGILCNLLLIAGVVAGVVMMLGAPR